MQPLVSVTMTTYNRAAYIREAIDSVLAQSYQTFELIIVDDGSTDRTEEIVHGYADERIRYIKHGKNSGIAKSRSTALAAAKGSYIAVLDSDDLWNDPHKLEMQVAFLEEHEDHAVIGTFIHLIDKDGNQIGMNEYHTTDSSIRNQILARNQFAHSSVLMRSSMVSQAGGYGDLPLGEDLDLFLRLGTLGAFANIPEYSTSYRVHEGGVSKNAIRIAASVHDSIWKYRKLYPNFIPALIKSGARMVMARISDTRTLRASRAKDA